MSPAAKLATAQRIPVLSFRLEGQYYGLFIEDVSEVAVLVEAVRVPDAPPALMGIVNRHGEALPLFDLRLLFSLPAPDLGGDALFIVATCAGQPVGLLVDEIFQVKYIASEELRRPSGAGKVVQYIFSEEERLLQILSLPVLLLPYLPAAETDDAG